MGSDGEGGNDGERRERWSMMKGGRGGGRQ